MARWVGEKSAHSPHNEVHGDSRFGGLVENLNHLWVNECIDLDR